MSELLSGLWPEAEAVPSQREKQQYVLSPSYTNPIHLPARLVPQGEYTRVEKRPTVDILALPHSPLAPCPSSSVVWTCLDDECSMTFVLTDRRVPRSNSDPFRRHLVSVSETLRIHPPIESVDSYGLTILYGLCRDHGSLIPAIRILPHATLLPYQSQACQPLGFAFVFYGTRSEDTRRQKGLCSTPPSTNSAIPRNNHPRLRTPPSLR